jgi:hypothetical protein
MMAEPAFTIGSYRRGTLIRAERDIDLMAVLNYPTYKATYDKDSRAFVRDKLNTGYATSKVSSRGVAILLDFTVIRADVVPAFRRTGGGYVILNGKTGWQATNPSHHTQLINDRDNALENRLKPLIRLLKFWNITNGGHLRSFHVELMVWAMWKNASRLPPLYSAAVAESLGTMRSWLRSSFTDPWDGGGRIDAYLGREDSNSPTRYG